MECVLSAYSLKSFTKALTCLSRIGESVSIYASKSFLQLSTINSSRSVNGLFTLDTSFFERYKVTARPTIGQGKGHGTVQIEVQNKAILSILKSSRLERTVESCEIVIVSEDLQKVGDGIVTGRSGESRVVIRLWCKHGVVKTHRLLYSPLEQINVALCSRTRCTSFFVTSAQIIEEWTNHFWTTGKGGVKEITLLCGAQKMVVRSSDGDLVDEEGGSGKSDHLRARPMSTTLTLDTEIFDRYIAVGEPLLTFSLKEFKAVIAFAEAVNSSIDSAFTQGGEPLLLTIKTETLVGEFTIATSDADPSGVKAENQQAGVKKERGSVQPTTSRASPIGKSTSSGTKPGFAAVADTEALRQQNRPEPGPSYPKPLFNPASDDEGAEDEYNDALLNAALTQYELSQGAHNTSSNRVREGNERDSHLDRDHGGEDGTNGDANQETPLIPDSEGEGEADGESVNTQRDTKPVKEDGGVDEGGGQGMALDEDEETEEEEMQMEEDLSAREAKRMKWNLFGR